MIINNQKLSATEIVILSSRIEYRTCGKVSIPTYEAGVTRNGKTRKKKSEDLSELQQWVLAQNPAQQFQSL